MLKKVKIISLILVCGLCFSMIGTVRAFPSIGSIDGAGGVKSKPSRPSGGSSQPQTQPSPEPDVAVEQEPCEEPYDYKNVMTDRRIEPYNIVRVTAYSESGERLSDSIDYVGYYKWYNNDTWDWAAAGIINNIAGVTHILESGKKRSRIDYINDYEGKSQNLMHGISYADLNIVTSGSVNVLSQPIGGGFITNSWFVKDYSTLFLANDRELLKTFFGEVSGIPNYAKSNYCSGSYASKCLGLDDTDIYILFEPVGLFKEATYQDNVYCDDNYEGDKISESYYYGTWYELIELVNQMSPPEYYCKYNKHESDSPCYYGSRWATDKDKGVNGLSHLTLYVTDASGKFTDFYNNIGVKPLNTTTFNEADLNHILYGGSTDYFLDVHYGFGMYVMRLDEIMPPINDEEPDPEPEDPTPSTGTCDAVITNLYEDKIVNGPVKYDSTAICYIQCSEKYMIEAWKLNRTFSYSLLAGTYVPIDAPAVYHQKTCTYESRVNEVDSLVSDEISRECYYTEEQEDGTTVIHEVPGCREAIVNKGNNVKSSCSNMEIHYKNMVAEKEQDAQNDTVGDIKLTLFSDYYLEADTDSTIHEYLDDDDQYRWKNTFFYRLKGDINRYIDLNDVYNQSGATGATTNNYDNGIAKITTPINAVAEGATIYQYKTDYSKVFSSTFVSNFGDIDNSIQECNYTIVQRDNNIINNYCYSNCDNPDTNFLMVKLKALYRPINLSVPFPGIDYTDIERTPGSNWSEENIQVVIKENRYTEGDSMYNDREPLYVIDLDASIINKIREYNDTHNYDDFTLACTAGTGDECISKFLKGKLDDWDTRLVIGGMCASLGIPDDTNSRSTSFYTCADKQVPTS